MTSLPVFSTESRMVLVSSGTIVAGIYDLDRYVLGFQFLSDGNGPAQHSGERDHGDVRALMLDVGHAERDRVVIVVLHLSACAGEVVVLEEHHGVVVADGGL